MPEVNQPKRRKPLSKRQRARLVAGREPTPAHNIRSILMAVITVGLIAVGVFVYLNRETILVDASEGQTNVEICTVTKLNNTNEFQTDCGRMKWGENLGKTPYLILQVGGKYSFTTAGPDLPILSLKPTVTAYTAVP